MFVDWSPNSCSKPRQIPIFNARFLVLLVISTFSMCAYIHIYMYIYIYIYTYIFSVLKPLSHGMSWAIPCNSPCGSMLYGPFHSTAHVLREIRPIFQGLVNVRHLNIPDPSIGDFSSPETFSGFS